LTKQTTPHGVVFVKTLFSPPAFFNMDLQLKNKTALVTAASRGLGRASALALAREGCRVMISARSASIFETAEQISQEVGSPVLAVQGDVSNPADVSHMVNSAIQALGHLDILVINAGGPKPGAFLQLSPADWQAATQLTLMSAVNLCYAVLPHMQARQTGSIVAIQSVSVKQPIAELALSNALRMAVIGMLKTLANEVGAQGIRVNSLNPTYTQTERVMEIAEVHAATTGQSVAEVLAQRTSEIPLRRMGSVEEFGKTLAWLASPAASFVHGHALMFDGGAVKSAL
jgi:3-oxoacyl-[acyl-carrier protein] reductase